MKCSGPLLILLLLFASPPAAAAQEKPAPEASSFLTRPGFAACLNRQDFHAMMSHVARGDTTAVRVTLTDPESGCFRLKPGVEVTLVQFYTTFVEIHPIGLGRTIWTVTEALERKVQSNDD